MFIIAWLVVLVLRANDIVVPGSVSFLVGLAAIIETSFYVICFLLFIVSCIIAWKDN